MVDLDRVSTDGLEQRVHCEMYGSTYRERWVLFLILFQDPLYLESQQFSAKVRIRLFIRSCLSATGKVSPPSACGVRGRWGRAGLLVRLQRA